MGCHRSISMSEEELDLESLEGVGPATKQKLTAAGIYNVLDLVSRGPIEISDVVNIDLSRAIELVNKARVRLVTLGRIEKDFISATELYKKRQTIERIGTGSKNLDDLLGGGIETQAVTELYGEYGSGKTQLCHTLCVKVQTQKDQGGLSSGAIYVDTENTFRPERIVEIAEAYNLEPEEVLSKIIVAEAYNSAHQELIVREAGRFIEKERIRLLVVDSAVAHYRAEFLGRGTLAERQQRLNRFMHNLLRLAELYNVAVVVTNQVQSAPDVFFGDPTRPVGGHVVAHTSTYRIYLRKAGKNRIARMMDSPCHPEREVVFILDGRGINDPPEETPKRRQS
ncbi:MAG: DNA repair and recombination protein RadA [Nitrososphaerales archaeon]|nr:DNA repair and recombination protein RadA [Nitrososphaerales archaeon]